MKLKSLAIFAIGVAVLTSCSTKKTTLPYFTDLSEVAEGTLPSTNYGAVIQPDDELLITVTSSYPEATAEYNLPLTNPAIREKMEMASTPQQQTYIVNSEGDITMPIIGKLHVSDYTTEQLQKHLTEIITKDVADAIVRVELVNFQVVVAGEVLRPSTVKVTRNRFSILDAISEAGDLTQYGERSRVLVVREENGQRTFAHLNLNSSEIFSSPYFYVKQNDYIYVEPNEIRQANSKYNQDNAFKLQVVSTLASASSVIVSLIIALSAK